MKHRYHITTKWGATIVVSTATTWGRMLGFLWILTTPADRLTGYWVLATSGATTMVALDLLVVPTAEMKATILVPGLVPSVVEGVLMSWLTSVKATTKISSQCPRRLMRLISRPQEEMTITPMTSNRPQQLLPRPRHSRSLQVA
jgi:hypothetical protein